MKRINVTFYALCFSLVSILPAWAESRFEIKQIIVEEAARSKVPAELALAVAKVESDFNDRALSSVGARGVMQIMPETAKGEFNVGAGALWDAKTNVRLGISYLERLHSQYDGRWDLALSHYNGGTVKGDQPHDYTKKYVATVLKWQEIYREQALLWSDPNQSDEDRASDQQDNQETAEVSEFEQWRPLENWRNRPSNDDFEDQSERYEVVIQTAQRRAEPDYWRAPPPPPNWRRPPPRRGQFFPPPRRGHRF